MKIIEGIKNLITRKSKASIDTTSIVGYDTSLVYIPKYNSLSKDEKKKVDEYIEEAKVEDIDDLILYGMETNKYSSAITDLLLKLLYRTTEGLTVYKIDKKQPKEIAKKRIETMIAHEEIEYYYKGLKQLNKELELRTVALEEIYKRNEGNILKRILKGSKQEGIQKKFVKARYKEAIERMKISKKVVEQQIQAVMNAVTNMRNNRASNRNIQCNTKR